MARTIGAAVGLLLGGLIVTAAPASAHAIVVDIVPDDGALLDESPAVVTVRFTETVSLATDGNVVLDPDAAPVAAVVDAVGDEVRYALPSDLADGTYVITWRVISADSHPVAGSSIFHVGAPSASPPVVPGTSSASGAGLLRLLGTSVGVGAALVAIGAGRFAPRWPLAPARRVDALVRRGSLVGLLALPAVVAARVVELEGRWPALAEPAAIRGVLEGPVGWSALLLAAGLAVFAFTPRRPGFHGVGWAGAGLVIAGLVVEGHTRAASPAWVAVTADIVHVGAAAVWVGGVAALAAARTVSSVAQRRTIAADVSGVAVVAVAVTALAGIAQAVVIAPDLAAVTSTTWGRAILAKVGLVVALVVVGGYNRYRIVPRLAGGGPEADRAGSALRASLGTELVLFAAVLLAAAVAVGSSPIDDRVPANAALGASVAESIPLSSGVGTVDFALAPGSVGYNDLYLQLSAPDDTPLATLWDPAVELSAPDRDVEAIELAVHALGDGSYHVPLEVPFPGLWVITVDARTGTFESGRATFTITVG